MRAPKWDDPNRFGKNRVLQSSYIWLVVVPMAAKALSAVDEPLVLTGISEGLRLHLTLPFSWQVFYFSAVFVSVAGVIYLIACPELIKRFNTFAEFRAVGQDFEYLHTYAERLEKQARGEKDGPSAPPRAAEVKQIADNVRRKSVDIDGDEALRELYWRMHTSENSKSPTWRSICHLLYWTGLLLILVVLFQNFVFVVRAIFLPDI